MTMPMLIASWILALLFFGLLVANLYHRRWFYALLTYLFTGYFAVAFPFKAMLAATSFFGIVFLSTVWPVWLAQGLFGYHMLDWFPKGFLQLLFNF